MKNYVKIAPKVELKEINKTYGSKNKNKNLQIKLEPKNSIAESSNNNYAITESEEKLKNNFKYLNTKNNKNKIKNLNEILRKNIYLTRNINKTIQENSYYRHSENNSFKNIPFTTIPNHNNSKTSFHFKKIIYNPFLKKINKNKKDIVTVKNTVINLNMVNSNLIISSTNKKKIKSNNSLNKKNTRGTNLNLNHQSQISQNISKNEINYRINNKLKLLTNFDLKYNLLRNFHRKDLLNSSQNWAKTEGNEITVNKMKNKLEEIKNKLKRNFFWKDIKHTKFNSMRLDELNKNKLKKITKTKTTVLSKPLSKKK